MCLCMPYTRTFKLYTSNLIPAVRENKAFLRSTQTRAPNMETKATNTLFHVPLLLFVH